MITCFKRLFKKKPTTLLELFKYIKSTGISDDEKYYGICQLVFTKYYVKDRFDLKDLFKKWPNFSGCIAYPIPSYIGYKKLGDIGSNLSKGIYYNRSHKKWDKSTDYGKARWNFIEWAIEELEGKHE